MRVNDELLTAAEISRRAGVHRSTVSDWIKGNQLEAAGEIRRGTGTQPLFRLEDAQRLIDRTARKREKRESTSDNV